jgi:hypothetical protein
MAQKVLLDSSNENQRVNPSFNKENNKTKPTLSFEEK